MQQCSENLEKSEERRLVAQVKLTQAMETAEDAKRFVARYHLLLFYKISNIPYIYILFSKKFLRRICKVLENRSKLDEERMDQLTAQLKEARLIAEDADNKSDEISRKLTFVEDELEAAEERVKSSEAYVLLI